MATACINCSLCDVFFRRQRNSSSSEFVLPLLKQMVADVFDKADKLRNVSSRFDV